MATNEQMFVSAFQEKVAIRPLIWQICSAMSANDLINFWDQTILKWPFSGHFEFCNIYLTQEMQNDWNMNIKLNGISHQRMTNFTLKNPKWPRVGRLNFF